MITNGILCFAAYKTQFSPNYFPGIKLIISLADRFSCVVNENQVRNVSGLILNRMVVHTMSAPESGILIYYVDRHSVLESILLAHLDNGDWCDISPLVENLPVIQPVESRPDQPDHLLALAGQLLLHLFPALPGLGAPAQIAQIEPVLQYIEDNIQRPIYLADLAPLLQLSLGRTRHVFLQHVGMPFSRYIIWMRLRRVIHLIRIQPQPLGETAIYCGFSDPSHFNRLFKRTFGTLPRRLLSANYQFLSI